jgi:hypothetical protein
MTSYDSKVIGYIASTSRTNVICTDVDACVVAGSEKAMNDHISELNINNKVMISVKKARFGDIVKVMRLGGKYAFDKESYSRFYPLGKKNGLLLENPNFDDIENEGKFFTVRIDSKSL